MSSRPMVWWVDYSNANILLLFTFGLPLLVNYIYEMELTYNLKCRILLLHLYPEKLLQWVEKVLFFKVIPRAVFNDDAKRSYQVRKITCDAEVVRKYLQCCGDNVLGWPCLFLWCPRTFLICFNNQVFNYSLSTLHYFVPFS